MNSSPIRRIHAERLVRTPAMVVGEVTAEDLLEVSFAEHDDVIQALAADGTDESLDVGILPGAAGRDPDLLDSSAAHTSLKTSAVDRVAIPEEERRRIAVGERCDDLLGGPLGRWVHSQVEVKEGPRRGRIMYFSIVD